MSIYNDCKIVINLNQLVKDRPCGVDLADEHVDNIANDLRKRMTFDSLFGQVDTAIWEYAEECREFGFTIPQYGDTQPKPGREAWLNQIEKNQMSSSFASHQQCYPHAHHLSPFHRAYPSQVD